MSAERAVAGVSRDYKKYVRWMAITKNRMELAEKMYHSKQEGRAEKTFEIARKMKEMGLPITQIAEGTGLPIETIEQITANK